MYDSNHAELTAGQSQHAAGPGGRGSTGSLLSAVDIRDFEGLLARLPLSAWLLDARTLRLLEFNERAAVSLGYTREEFARLSLRDIEAIDTEVVIRERIRQLGTGELLEFESQHRTRRGELRNMLVLARAVELGEVKRILVLTVDMTQRMEAERSLSRALEQRRLLMARCNDGIAIINQQHELVEANPRFAHMLGYELDEVIGMHTWDWEAHMTEEQIRTEFADLSGTDLVFETRHRRKDGSVHDVEVSVGGVVIDGEAFVFTVSRDISERKRNEQLLRRRDRALEASALAAHMLLTENSLDVAINGALALIGEASEQDRAYLFEAHLDVTGTEPLLSQRYEWVREGIMPQMDNPKLQNLPLHRVVPDWYRQLRSGALITGTRADFPKPIQAHLQEQQIEALIIVPIMLGSQFWGFMGLDNCRQPYAWSGGEQAVLVGTTAAIGAAIIRRRAEEEEARLREQLLQSQKLESIGRLAGGVAHDFNNMLSVITGHTELALEELDAAHPIHEDLREILQAAERSADLTRQLLAFARKQTVSPRMIDCNEAVGSTMRMLRRLIGESIELIWLPSPESWWVRIDPTQLDQILTNLCLNARDSINGSGRITIETRLVNLGASESSTREGIAPGEYVRLVISDNGCGIPAIDLPHIFEPFFTTKDLGQGTGLGLSTVYGAIRQNHGFIEVHSTPGVGSSFCLHLPRHAASLPSSAAPKVGRAIGGGETVLLVEDEAAILRMIHLMLRMLGYQVLIADSPAEALRIASERTDPIDLLLTDVVMPDMNGRVLASGVHQLHPEAKCLFMSGYTAEVIANDYEIDANTHFIAKPFSRATLAQKLRVVLGPSVPRTDS